MLFIRNKYRTVTNMNSSSIFLEFVVSIFGIGGLYWLIEHVALLV